jgi:hypothetical protein
MDKRTTANFRQRLETVTAPVRASAGAEMVALVEDLINCLCRAYTLGGLAESRRAVDKITALFGLTDERRCDRKGGQV